jgi:CRP/FNR family cyclic AMP-dependent transcriptional regulator
MHIRQSDLFSGLGHDFLKEIMLAAETITFEDGGVVFDEDDRADHFYIMTSGRVRLYMAASDHDIHTARAAGEIIGWSTLIGRDSYSLSAVCEGPTVLLRIDRERMNAILARDNEIAARFFMHLAGALGHRLLQLYPRVSKSLSSED